MSLHVTGPQDTTELRDGVRIPRLGLGVFRAGAGSQTKADVYDLTLTGEEMARLDALDEGLVTGWDPTHAP